MQVENSVVLLQWITRSGWLLLFLSMAATEVNQQWVGSAAQGRWSMSQPFDLTLSSELAVTLTAASMGKVLSLQCIALSCCSRVWGPWRLMEG